MVSMAPRRSDAAPPPPPPSRTCRRACLSSHSSWSHSRRNRAEVGRRHVGAVTTSLDAVSASLPDTLPSLQPSASPPADPRTVAITRIGGLATGVAVMLLMSILILPKSASIEALRT